MKNINAAILFVIIINGTVAAQTFGAGGFLGGGHIKGNSPEQGSYTTSLFIETDMPFTRNVLLRLSFLYAADFNSILPDSRIVYRPFVKGITVKAVLQQPAGNSYYLEEGIGLLLLNDRTFSDTDEINYGLAVSFLAGIDFRKHNYLPGFKLGAGAEYGLTFTNTLARYLSIHIQGEYYIP